MPLGQPSREGPEVVRYVIGNSAEVWAGDDKLGRHGSVDGNESPQ